VLGLGEPLQELELITVLRDDAFKADARDLVSFGEPNAIGGRKGHEAKGDKPDHDRQAAPNGQAPPETAAIEYGLGF
jgi:hypothetical protein